MSKAEFIFIIILEVLAFVYFVTAFFNLKLLELSLLR